MKQLLVLISCGLLLTNCGAPRKTNTGESTASNRFSTGSKPIVKTVDDSVTITGTEYVTIEGRSEFGTRADLEGSWELESIGSAVAIRQERKVTDLNSNVNGGKNKGTTNNRINNANEVNRDSVVTRTADGVVYTTTTIYLVDKDGNTGNKITPQQGQKMHLPARPSLNFYGSNETFSGFTGCNKISGRITISGSNISFQHSAPSTRMVCIGDFDEEAFLNTLHRVNQFRSTKSELKLMEGDKVLLQFARK